LRYIVLYSLPFLAFFAGYTLNNRLCDCSITAMLSAAARDVLNSLY